MGWFVTSTHPTPNRRYLAMGPFETENMALTIGIMRCLGDTRYVDAMIADYETGTPNKGTL